MSKIFTRTYRARYSDINSNGMLAPADVTRYIIDTAYDWGESLGLGYQESIELGLIWVIRETEVQFTGALHFLDEFEFTIWMLDWKRVRGTRAFMVKKSSNGAIVAQGTQQIACLDSQTLRPTSPPMDLIENLRLESPQNIESQPFPKMPALPEYSFTIQRHVAWQDIDILDMVNNAVYISYAEDAVTQLLAIHGWSPQELKTRGFARTVNRVHIQYQAPAIWGDTLEINTFVLHLDDSEGSFFVDLRRQADEAAIASCVLDWRLVDRENGEVRPLPTILVKALSGSTE